MTANIRIPKMTTTTELWPFLDGHLYLHFSGDIGI